MCQAEFDFISLIDYYFIVKIKIDLFIEGLILKGETGGRVTTSRVLLYKSKEMIFLEVDRGNAGLFFKKVAEVRLFSKANRIGNVLQTPIRL